jgi:hypothetical protein
MRLQTSVFILAIALLFTACRKEETELIQTPEEEVLNANSNMASLITRTTSNDGSEDNIVDRANCFDIIFPYTVTVNLEQVVVNSQDDLALIECVFDASDSDTDTLTIDFPITILLDDFSQISINSISEFNNYVSSCSGEHEVDMDIECIDFEYPIVASRFNASNELLETITLEDDAQLYGFIGTISENDITTMDFPLEVTLYDATQISVNNFVELESVITNAIEACDEDDDYDYSDDDCEDCTTSDLQDILVNCTDWTVNRLKRFATDYDNNYDGYYFNFFSDNTLSVFWGSTTVYGTWTANGSGNTLEVVIDVPALPLCNNNWVLQEIKNCSDKTEINLVVGDDDRLQYENGCN